jgi:hypothetical protein
MQKAPQPKVHLYKFINKNVKNRKTYWYKLEDVDIHQKNTMCGPVSAMPKLISGIDRRHS